jgi:P27 family predicted phage terminase small subunit
LKQLRGNPGKRRLNHDEPIPPGELNEPPDWMTAAQKAGWNYAIEHAPRGLLKQLDRSTLVAWVVAEDLHRNASMMIEKFGLLTKAPHSGMPMQSPYLPIVNKQAMIMLKAVEQLGFSSASRSRIQLPYEPPPGPSEWDLIDPVPSQTGEKQEPPAWMEQYLTSSLGSGKPT